jgi:uncharacterized protein involved in exopolysaccharide biosynthesis
MSETPKQETNLYDKIRADADEKRKARIKEKEKTDEFFARMKNGTNPLEEINRQLKGELNK